MKKQPSVRVFRSALCALCAALFISCKSGITFVPANDFSVSSGVNIINIDDFERLVRNNHVRFVFYTDSYFIAQVNGVLYTMESRSYTNFREYREGKLKEPVPWAVFKPVQK